MAAASCPEPGQKFSAVVPEKSPASNPSPIKKSAMNASPMWKSRVQIHPEQHQGSGPPQQAWGRRFGGIEQQQENTGEQQRKHLGTNSPGRGGGQRTPKAS
jgi:hypothetical protein